MIGNQQARAFWTPGGHVVLMTCALVAAGGNLAPLDGGCDLKSCHTTIEVSDMSGMQGSAMLAKHH